jgi:hypothetical protein
MMMGFAWTAIAALIAVASVWPAAAAPARPEIAARDAVIEVDGRRHRHHGHRHHFHHHDYYQYHRPYRGYRPHPGYFQPLYYPPYPYPPRYKYLYPPQSYGPSPGFHFYYRN